MSTEKSEFLTSFFNSLKEYSVEYFVYGEYENLPKSTGTSDLDMIICESHKNKFIQILSQLAKKNNVLLVSYYTNPQTLFYRFFYYTKDVCWGLQLDVFFKGFYHQNKCYYPKNRLEKDIILHNNIYVLDIEKSYYVGFLKEILHTKQSKEKYVVGFLNLINKNPIFYKKELSELYGRQFAEIIFNNNEKQKLSQQFYLLHQQMYKHVHKKDFFCRLLVKLNNIKRLLNKKPGYVIAVLGTDGSGKSTIINAITPILNETFHNGVCYKHLRPGLLPDIGILLGKREKSFNPVTDPHNKKTSGIIISFFRWKYYLIDYTFGYLKNIYPIIHSKSKIFIFDRYYYDYYIDQKRFRTNLPKCILHIGDFFVPKPDLILCLGTNPTKIFNRKPETSIEEVEKQTNILKKIVENRNKFVWIDTGTSIEESVTNSLQAIHQMMKKRNFKIKNEYK